MITTKMEALVLLLMTSVISFGQENQNVLAKKIGDDVIRAYGVRWDRSASEYIYEGCCQDNYQLTFADFDGKLSFAMQGTESTSTTSYYVDEEAFPVTFIKGRVRGNEEQQERLKVIDYTKKERMVFLDGWVYLLDNWVNKDEYLIKKIFAPGELKGLKMTKEIFAAAKKMQAADHEATLQKYLDEAFAKQAEALKTWNIDNAAKITQRKQNEKIMDAEIKATNDSYWTSEEGQEKLRQMRLPDITLVNDTGADFGICYGSGVNEILKPGESTSLSCQGGTVYLGLQVAGASQLKQDRSLFSRSEADSGKVYKVSEL